MQKSRFSVPRVSKLMHEYSDVLVKTKGSLLFYYGTLKSVRARAPGIELASRCTIIIIIGGFCVRIDL